MADIRLRILVDGKDAVPEAMKSATAAVEASSKRIEGSFARTRQLFASLKTEFVEGFREGAAQAEAANQKTEQSSKEAAAVAREEFHRARGSVDLLSESIGIGIPRELRKIISASPALQGALSAAFSAVTIVAFIQILREVPKLIEEMTDKIAGWDEAAKEAFKRASELNHDLSRALEQQKDQLRDVATIGLEGSAKLGQEQKILQDRLSDTSEKLKGIQRDIVAIDKENEKLKPSTGLERLDPVRAVMDHIVGASAKYAENEKNKANLLKEQNELLILQKQLQGVDAAKLTAERNAQAIKDARALEQARIDAEARVLASSQSAAEAMARSRIALADLTASQEADIYRELENRKFEDSQRILEKRLDQAEKLRSRDPAGSAVAVAKVNSEIEAARTEHNARIAEIDAQQVARTRVNAEEKKRAEISAAQDSGEQQFAIDRQFIAQQEAQHRLSIQQAADLEEIAATTHYERKRAAMEAELELARQFPERNKAQIIALEHELEVLERTHQAELVSIKEAAAAKQMELDRRLFDQRMRAAEAAADFELQQEQRKLGERGLGGFGGMKEQEAALDHWYAKKLEILNQQLEQARQIYGIESVEYQKVVEEMNQLDRARLQEQQRISDQTVRVFQDCFGSIDRSFNANILEWVKGQQTFGRSMMETWNQLAANAIQNMLRMAEQALLSAIIHKSIAKDSILADAKAAAAGVWKSVMHSGIPFPINVAVGAVAAGGVFAAVMALNSFDRGGIVPADDVGMLHRNEMVLPANISEGLQKALAGGNGLSGGNTVHMGGVHVTVQHNAGQIDETAIAKAVQRAVRRGFLSAGGLA